MTQAALRHCRASRNLEGLNSHFMAQLQAIQVWIQDAPPAAPILALLRHDIAEGKFRALVMRWAVRCETANSSQISSRLIPARRNAARRASRTKSLASKKDMRSQRPCQVLSW